MTKIYIDAGHGGSDPGASGNGIKEKDITLAIAKEVRDYLEDYEGVKTKMSRSGDTYPSLKYRTDQANKWKADFFLSIHINSGGGTGFESYRYTSLSQSSKTGKMQAYIHNAINQVNDMSNRGMKAENFHVLRESAMPAILTENGFIDTRADAAKMKDKKWIAKVAKAHADGIAQAFGLKKKKEEKPKKTTKLYKVQTGAFSDKRNAIKQSAELKKKGFEAFIVKE